MNKKIKVALAGNPNCGKTTLFNKLTKSRHKTGNYPGVTVELCEGNCLYNDLEISILDLPGIYSLTSHSEEEIITRDYITNKKPDVVINIIDASNIERGLYLTTQLMELQVPIILVCNKIDIAKAHDIKIDFEKLSSFLEVSVVPANLIHAEGIEDLLKQIEFVSKKKDLSKGIYLKFSQDIENSIYRLESILGNIPRSRWYGIKLIESDTKINRENFSEDVLNEAEKQNSNIKNKYGISPEEKIAIERNQILSTFIKNISDVIYKHKHTLSDKIDKIVLNKYLGIPIFFLLMYVIFQFTFSVGVYPSIFLQNFFHKLSFLISHIWESDSLFRSLLVDGIIGGVGSVLSFVPNILLLFIAISFLEESGYMARVAYVMDRVMHKIGLHGRSFMPMIIGLGCTVPAIMSTRILENRRDKITTILVLPLVACSAKLAVFTLLIPAFFSPLNSARIVFLLYFIGIVIAILLIKILRRSLFKGENIQFIMDMPHYQMPSLKNILLSTWEKAGLYVKKAGTFILAISIVLWFLSVFPINKKAHGLYLESYSSKQKQVVLQLSKISDNILSNDLTNEFNDQAGKQRFIRNYSIDLLNNEKVVSKIAKRPDISKKIILLQDKFNEEIKTLKNQKNKEQLYDSFMGKIGRGLEFIFAPLGFDWRINTALIGALSAKEVFISQLGIIFAIGEANDNVSMLQKQLNQSYSTLQGFCILLFMLISAPCIATIAMTKKETGLYKWAFIQLGALTVLAYVLTLIVYQIAKVF